MTSLLQQTKHPRLSTSHRIRMASSPSGSLLLFFSVSFAFFFFLKLILSFSLLDRTLCSWWALCCAKALDLGSLSVTLNRCLSRLPPSLSTRCCLTLLTTRNTTRASTSRRPIATATTAHSQAGVCSSTGKNREHFYQTVVHFNNQQFIETRYTLETEKCLYCFVWMKVLCLCVSVCGRDRMCELTFDFLYPSFLVSASYFLFDASNSNQLWEVGE